MPVLKHRLKRVCAGVRSRCLRLREVVSDEVRTLEEQKNVAEAVTLQGSVQRDPVGILEGTQTRTCIQQEK